MLSKWCQRTSINGAIDWYESRDKRANFVFWSIVMISMIMCCIYFTCKTVEDYYRQPTTTNMKAEQNNEMPFPEILICYNGGLNVEAMKNAGFDVNYIRKLIGQMLIFETSLTEKELEIIDNQLKTYLQTEKMNMRDFLRKFAYSCSDILVHNSLETKTCDNISHLYSNLFGRCPLFRNNGHQLHPGISAGLKFRLKFPTNSFYEFSPKLATDYNMNKGFYFSFDQRFRWITRRWSLVPANVKAEIVISVKHHIRLAQSVPCDDRKNVYSSNTCFHRCYAEAFYKFCNCSVLEYLDSPDDVNITKVCRPTECWSFDYNLSRPCQKRCRPKCDDWVYDASITYSFFHPSMINQSESIVWVGYNTMEFVTIEELDAFTIHMGLANVGGQAGLWFGVSLVTIIQGLYYLAASVYQKLSDFTQRSENSKTPYIKDEKSKLMANFCKFCKKSRRKILSKDTVTF